MTKSTYELLADEFDNKHSVRKLRAYNPNAAVKLMSAQATLAVLELKERIAALRGYISDTQACDLIRTVDPSYLQKVYQDGYNAAANVPRTYTPPKPVREEIDPSKPLFPYASSAIMERVQRLVKDVEFIRDRVLDGDGKFVATEEGVPTASVRDLSSFVGAVNSLYTTVGNLEPTDKIRQDMNKMTHAISEAALTLPAAERSQFLDAFKEVLSRR